MKKLKSLLPFLLMLFALVGCKTDDLEKDIDSLKDRVSSLEAQVSLLNDNMNAVRVILDGNKTISSYTVEDGTYTLTLSDGSTISLTQGSEGQILMPEISINDNGEWVLNGEVIGQATGESGVTPKFTITTDGYWQISTDGGVTYEDVLDEEGNKVQATTNGDVNVSDAFFEEVTVENGMLKVKLNGETEYRYLPIVEDLKASITDPTENFKNGVWTIGSGETATTEVEISGDNYFVTVPAGGWTATLSEVSEGKATLTVTAPAQLSTASRATADNSTELVLQVNKGVNWAIDKIKVEAKEVVSSYSALFEAGNTINIAGVELKKSDWESVSNFTIKTISSDGNSTEANQISGNGIYFIQSNAVAEYTFTGAVTNLFIIKDNSSDNTASLKMSQPVKLNNGTQASGTFLCEGVGIDASEMSNYQMTANGYFGNVIFSNCSFALPAAKSFCYISGTQTIQKISLEGCKINWTGKTEKQMFNVQKTTFGEINLVNNTFYAKDSDVNLMIFNFAETMSCPKLTMTNNTFVNAVPLTNGYIKCSSITGNIDIEKNLFYSADFTSNQLLFRLPEDTESVNVSGVTATCQDNFGNKGNSKTWKLFYTNDVFTNGDQITCEKEEIFSTMDYENGIFTPIAEYADYGAQIE